MGVMKCNRKGCDNILCKSYNPQTGYICNDCLNEMKESQKQLGKDFTILDFMSTQKEEDIDDIDAFDIDIDEFFGVNAEVDY